MLEDSMLFGRKAKEKNARMILDGYLSHAATLAKEADFAFERGDNASFLRLNQTAMRVITQLGQLRGYASDNYFMGGKDVSREYVEKIDVLCDDLDKKCLSQRFFGK